MISLTIHGIFALVVTYGFGQFTYYPGALSVTAFVPVTIYNRPTLVHPVVSQLTSAEETGLHDDGDDDKDEDEEFLLEDSPVALDATEMAWRYAKKPLLRIGSKGATHSHGNSLRQLLLDHTVVKVKVNTKKFNNSVQQAYETLRTLAVENGAPDDIELIQLREGSKEILFAMPGTLKKMEQGSFPPPVPVENGDADISMAA
jgi:RNA-binding protein YhbY